MPGRPVMTTSKLNKFWTPVTILLIAIIIFGGIVIWAKRGSSQAVEISMSPAPEISGEICISGAVSNPGIYPLRAGDSIEDLIQAAGGTTISADLTRVVLNIPEIAAAPGTQKVDLNRAELWLLEALPGIGQTRAQAIIDYRQQNGLFHSTGELARVDGIGITTYEQIKHLVTVTD
jgi:competence protein ComEA